MSNSRNAFTSRLHRLGVVGPAGVCVFGGSGAPKTSRGSGAPTRLILAILATTLAALAFSAAPALAAAPVVVSEFTSPTALPSGEANLEAAVNPENEQTECHFQYGETVVSEHEVACTVPAGGIAEGGEQRASVNVKGLKAGTTYHYRVVLKNASGKAEGAPAEVTTVPAPSTEVPSSIGATTATFNGKLTPLNENVETEYFFFYNVGEEAFCLNEHATGGTSAGKGLGVADVTMAVSGLEPSQKYTVCLADTNVFGGFEESLTPKYFETLPALPEVVAESEHAFEVKATKAMLSAGVNPNNQSTTYAFEYATNAALTENLVSVAGGSALSGYNLAGEPAGVALSGLTSHKAYYYRVVAENAKGEKAAPGKVESFITGPLEAPVNLEANPVGTTTVTLKGVLNPAGEVSVGSYEFLYKQSATTCEGEGASGGSALGSEKEAVETKIEGLLPDVTYTACLRAHHENEEQTSAPVTFTTHVAPPKVEELSVTEVVSSSATLLAKVNPQGAPTTYTFEYAPQGGTFTPVAEAEGSGALPEGDSPVGVSVHVQHGLLPGTSYEFRVAAHNSAATVTGTSASFTTLPPSGGGYALPDNRQWEMVSAPDKYGALIEPINESGIIQSSVDGSAFTYITSAPPEEQPQGNADVSQIFATRGEGGWSDQDIATPNASEAGISLGNGQEYRFFSPDLSRAIVEPLHHFTPFVGEETSPHATEKTPSLREDFTCQATPATCYTPLLTEADVTSGAKFGEAIFEAFEGATPDLSHVVLHVHTPNGAAAVSLTKATPNTPAGAGESLYEWSADKPLAEQLQLVSVLPKDEGGGAENGTLGAHDGHGFENRHALSNDGSRIVWSNGDGSSSMYMRDTTTEETLRIGGNETRFDDASSDDSKVFYTEGSGLYVFEETEASHEGGPLAGESTDLTGVGAGVQGTVLGASEDGSYVYFVANGVLTGTEENGEHDRALAGEENLYVERYNGETKTWEAPRFIAVLSGKDARDWKWVNLGAHTSGTSPDGRYLAFMSDRDLTGYDNIDASEEELESGEGRRHADQEVYLYHAELSSSGRLEPGKLVCASCNPTDARPDGERYFTPPPNKGGEGTENMYLAGGYSVWPEEEWLAANIPGWVMYSHKVGSQQPRYLSNSGRLFFNSHEALVPQDVNGTGDVYEYERPGKGGEGEGNCTTSTRSAGYLYNPRAEGCVGLISSGESSEESAFLEASANGGDVFFLTLSQLVPQDVDHSIDVYDAHECTSSALCFPVAAETPPPCTTEASCRPSPQPQPSIYGPPASATFAGPGNLAPLPPPAPAKVAKKKTVKCKKGLVKNKKGRCVRKKSKKRAKKSSKSNRGGKS